MMMMIILWNDNIDKYFAHPLDPLFQQITGASQITNEAKPIIQHNASEITGLIKVYKFVPLPCVRRKTVLRFSDTVVHYTP